jgi:hypothetical protein
MSGIWEPRMSVCGTKGSFDLMRSTESSKPKPSSGSDLGMYGTSKMENRDSGTQNFSPPTVLVTTPDAEAVDSAKEATRPVTARAIENMGPNVRVEELRQRREAQRNDAGRQSLPTRC